MDEAGAKLALEGVDPHAGVAVEEAVGKPIPYNIVERRAGDIAEVWAEPSRATEELGWRAERGIDEMAADAWRWQSKYPEGYADK